MDIDYHKAGELISQASNILLVSHRKPDGDTLGACLAIYHYVKAMGKQATLACIDTPSKRFDFMPGVDEYHKTFSLKDFDLVVVCDAGDSAMTNFHEIYPNFLSNAVPILNIDHHVSNDHFGKWNVVEATAASATIIVYKILKAIGVNITPAMAICLMGGIYNDTGAFMHANTNPEVFYIAADLMSTGIDASRISAAMFRTKPVTQLRLWGRVLERMKINDKNVLSAVLTQDDIRSCGARADETGGVIDLMSSVSGADLAMLVTEDGKGFIKGSFRTRRDDIDVEKIAKNFGGGGHKKASGFRMPGKLVQETVWKIIPDEGGVGKYVG
ncbi:MAG: bifunctional oligoribonuclease/PAP phosphatase NrnA [Patescibacteria group bacterium]